jgi:transposase-like protein
MAMRLKLLLPKVEPDVFAQPSECPDKQCGGKQFHLRQAVHKPVRDTVYQGVRARRYECLRCGQTFRVYPLGITADQTSLRLKGLAVLFYIMGLSYGAVSLVMTALGHPLGKTAAYQAVQAAGQKVAGLRRQEVPLATARLLVAALGADLTSVKCKGEWLTVGVTTDAIAGTTLTIDILENGGADTLCQWVREVAEAVGAEVLVSDDADGFKQAADENGLKHQVCKSHVVRNTQAWHDAMEPQLARDADGSLAAIGVTPEQALADNDELLRLIQERQPTPEAEAKLAEIHLRYAQAAAPKKLGQDQQTLAYRLRLFSLDRWNLWRRLTLYRGWRSRHGEQMDGTNNATERAIGWRIKERYRTMRGYKRPASVLNVSRLIAWAGNFLAGGGADLAQVLA